MAKKPKDMRALPAVELASADLVGSADVPIAPLAEPEESTAPGVHPALASAALVETDPPPAPLASTPVSDLAPEVASLREQLAAALLKADAQLGAASKKYEEADELRRRSLPPPPTELNEARIRAARLAAELTEVRADREEQRRKAESLDAELASVRGRLEASQAQLEAREARAALAEASAKDALQKAAHAEGSAKDALQKLAQAEAAARTAQQAADDADQRGRDSESRLQSLLEENRKRAALESDAARTITELKGTLDLAHREIDGIKGDLERSRFEGEANRQAALLREQHIVQEVRDREARMVAEVQAREAQLVAAAQAREAHLLADAKSALEGATQGQFQQGDQLARVQVAFERSREREAELDAELRVLRGRTLDGEEQLSEQVDGARREARLAQAELETLQERVGRAEARAAELLSTVDSLGRERAALRAEAGSMRARVEMLQAHERRTQELQAEVDELRGENEFLNQEVARYASASSPRISAPPPLPGKS